MLAEVWSYLTGDAAPPDVDVEPAVPWRSTLPVSCLAVSAVAAQLLAAQRLGAPTARGLVLDGQHVAAAFTSERHYRRVDAPGGVGFAALSRFHRTVDGWIRLHANYPHHSRAVHDALGPDPAARLLQVTADEAEDLVVREGGVAAAVRATRATGWLAGRMWVGRGGTKGVAKNGSSMYSRGEGALQRAWRGPAKKGKFGYSSNLTKSVKGRHDYVNFHINHGRWL